jgi:hypothetical protein
MGSQWVYFPIAEILRELFSYHGQVPVPLLSMCHEEVDIGIVQIDGGIALMASSNPVSQTAHISKWMAMV